MSKVKDTKAIEIITCDSGDWEVIKIDGEVYYENHKIPTYIWIEILESLGAKVFESNISDENMEYGLY